MRGNDVRDLALSAELAELIEDAWRATAPKRVVNAYDAADAG